MSLRDVLTAIALGHRPTTPRVQSKLRPDVYHNEPACRDCDWTGVGPLMETHAAHIADLQIAYLRDNLAQHADELGAERVVIVERERLESLVKACNESADDAAAEDAHCEEMFYRGQALAFSIAIDGTITTHERAIAPNQHTTDWSRADD